MPQCPICETPLKQNFGMVTCEECQAVLMIDISGQIQVGSEMADDDETTHGFTETQSGADESAIEDDHESEPTGFEEPDMSSVNGGEFADSDDNEFSSPIDATEFDSINPDEFSTISEHTQSPIDFDDSSEIDNSLGEIDEVEGENWTSEEEELPEEDGSLDDKPSVQAEPLADSDSEEDEDFSMPDSPDDQAVDITAFANSEVSSLEGGEYLYDIKVSRLDSREHKDNLKYVLMDRKLKIDGPSYIKAIKDGEVTILDLNPIKAKRVVEQLQFMDVDISWKQKRIVMQTDPDEEGTDDADL